MKKRRNSRKRSSSGLMGTGGLFLHLIRLFVGFVFVFSGFVKAVDPKGTVYKIEDYLTAFGGFFENLVMLAFPAAMLLILIEVLIGLMLLFQVRFVLTAWVTFAFMMIVTPLTLYIALNNPVTDCGCFGDALLLTNWQTFSKNVVFLLMTIVLLIWQKKFSSIYLIVIEWVMVGFFAVAGIAFMIYNLNHEPILDFRPYKKGTNIIEAMKIPEGAKTDSTIVKFVYEKGGVKKVFELTNLPDSTWKFVDQQTEVIRKGYVPPIHDFVILSTTFDDVTQEILNYEGKTCLIVIPDLNETSEKGMMKISSLIQEVKDKSFRVFALTSSPNDDIPVFKNRYKLDVTFFKMDKITLKTMMRSSPGVMYLDNGTIKGKWHWSDYRVRERKD